MSGEYEFGDYLIALVRVGHVHERFRAKVFRKDGKSFAFGDGVPVHQRNLSNALTTIISTSVFDTKAEAMAAGRYIAENCRLDDGKDQDRSPHMS